MSATTPPSVQIHITDAHAHSWHLVGSRAVLYCQGSATAFQATQPIYQRECVSGYLELDQAGGPVRFEIRNAALSFTDGVLRCVCESARDLDGSESLRGVGLTFTAPSKKH